MKQDNINPTAQPKWIQVQIEKKGKKKKSREEIFYLMEVFLFRSVVGSVFL